jgi:predicted RNA-binding Zn-ribbon protein involved in translation (DUF1610 family)
MTSEILPHIGSARRWLEVRYWFALHGCPQCGERSIGTPSSRRCSNVMECTDVTCPNCGHQRSIRFNILSSYDYPLGADLLQPRKSDRFREVGDEAPVRIDRLRVACMA